MSENWYYVLDGERIGPVAEENLTSLIADGTLGSEDYVWKKGFENWMLIRDVEELSNHLAAETETAFEDDSFEESSEELGQVAPNLHNNFSFLDFNKIDKNEDRFFVLTGHDRNSVGTQYGPFSLQTMAKLYRENRINAKTYIWTKGMESWEILADLPIYQELFEEGPPPINDADRRTGPRRPFVARIFFHDNKKLFEGVCRDISIGGMQVLVSNFPTSPGAKISLNVHPDNSDFKFSAEGKVVRVLEGNQGFSFRFTDLDEEAISVINSYVDQEP